MHSDNLSTTRHENLNGKLPDFDYTKKCARNIEADNRHLIDYLILYLKCQDNSNDVGLVLRESNASSVDDVATGKERQVSEVFVEKVKPFTKAYKAKFMEGDQIIQINKSLVFCKGQVLSILSQSDEFMVHIIRPQYVVSKTYGIQVESKSNRKSNLSAGSKVDIANGYPQIAITNSQNLSTTISLQQQLLQNLLEKKRHQRSICNESQKKPTVEISEQSNRSEWVVKKRSNGDRYITKRNRRDDEKPPRRRLMLPGRFVTSEGASEESGDSRSMKSEPNNWRRTNDNNNLIVEKFFTDENLLSVLTI